LHEAGVRGVRFNFVKRLNAGQPIDDRRAIVEKITPLGWHVVIYMEPDDLLDIRDFLAEIPLPVVIDHMGRVPVEEGVGSAAFDRLAALIDDEKYWLKVSCPERLSKLGPPYEDVDAVARALIEIIPDRVLWGTDWPHPNMKSHIPDDGLLVDRLVAICPHDAQRQALLVDNPARLYWNGEQETRRNRNE
jgi:2-pyrone-4,6-dicarboxylate lactonase